MATGELVLFPLEINGTTVTTEWGELIFSPLVVDSTASHVYNFTGSALTRNGVPLACTIKAFAYSDNSLVDSDVPDVYGDFELSFDEPCYIISIPSNSNYAILGFSVNYG